jgi:CheY-like chemotaxis protein
VIEVVTRQLQGTLDMQWPSDGLRLTATLPPTVYRFDPWPKAPTHNVATKVADVGLAGRRLLVVEDETLIAMELCQDLEALGWSILGPAATIEEAMRLIDGQPLPDAAVLDVNLGGKLVYPLAELLQAKGVPFVFCSGYQQLDDHENFRVWPLVRKPVNIALLDRELRQFRPAA